MGAFCAGGARPPVQAMIAYFDDKLGTHGVKPICNVLPIAPSTYHKPVAERRDPPQRSGQPVCLDHIHRTPCRGRHRTIGRERRRPLWRCFEAVEFAMPEWVDGVNNRRLLEPVGNIPHPPRPNNATLPRWTTSQWPRSSYQAAFENPGAVQNAILRNCKGKGQLGSVARALCRFV